MEPLPYRSAQPASSHRRRLPIWLLVAIGGLLHFLALMFVGLVDLVYDGAHAEVGRSHFARVMERVADRAMDVLQFPALPTAADSSCTSTLLGVLFNALTWGTAFALLVRLLTRRRRDAPPPSD